jgi:hydrogenase maturation protein HypF
MEKLELLKKTMTQWITTTSCGRLFDGVAVLLELLRTATFDGEAPMALEGIVRSEEAAPLSFELIPLQDGKVMLDWRPVIRELMSRRDEAAEVLSGAFHLGLAQALLEVCQFLRSRTGIAHVGFSGGVWQNRRLWRFASNLLGKHGFTLLTHKRLSPNDECISVGQAVLAAERLK